MLTVNNMYFIPNAHNYLMLRVEKQGIEVDMKAAEKRQKQAEALEYLREQIKENDTLHFITLKVSSSGMSRHISCLLVYDNAGVPGITNRSYTVAQAIGYRLNKDRDAIVSTGCGFSHAQAITEALSWALFGRDNTLNYHQIN